MRAAMLTTSEASRATDLTTAAAQFGSDPAVWVASHTDHSELGAQLAGNGQPETSDRVLTQIRRHNHQQRLFLHAQGWATVVAEIFEEAKAWPERW